MTGGAASAWRAPGGAGRRTGVPEMLRGLLLVLGVAAVLVVQVSIAGGFALPGGGPDLVVPLVVTMAFLRGARAGALIGFAVGLAVDILPPSDHVIGTQALVLCLIGYFAGRAGERAPGAVLSAAVVCAVAAPLLSAGLAALLGDPRAEQAVAARSWIPLVAYNLLTVPVVMWAVGRALGKARPRTAAVRIGRRA
nr:MAG: rod shape-determining protein MreD [Actinomycetota bacterium]